MQHHCDLDFLFSLQSIKSGKRKNNFKEERVEEMIEAAQWCP